MKILLSIIFFGIGAYTYAQLIDNSNCNAFTEHIFFDANFVKQNKIKSINGEIKTKGNLQVIKDSKLVSKYEFDREGKLVLQLGSFANINHKDTTFITYIYDDKGNLTTKRTNDAYGFFSYKYEFDEKNRKISKTYCREENKGSDRYHFKLGKQYIIVTETYSYIDKDSILIKSIYNNHNRVYQKTTSKYNEHHLLYEEVNQYVINRKKALTTYTHTDLGKVAEKKHIRNTKKPEEYERWAYQYDKLGSLTYIDYYKNGDHIWHKEMLYNKATFMLKALLIQDIASNFITIIKFETTYYD